MLSKFFKRSRSNKPQPLIPESRRLEGAEVSSKSAGRFKKKRQQEEDCQDIVRLSGNPMATISKKVEAEIRSEEDQEVYQYEMPTAEFGFGDMLKDHNPGERMTGVAVAKKSSQPREAIMRDLEQFQPEVKRRQIKLPKNFVLQLRGQEEKISFDQIFTRTNPRFPYILVRRMKFVLTPLSSFFDTFTNVNVMVLDTRMLNRPKRQTTVLNSNVDYRGNLSLDYCFPIASISKLFLYLNLEVVLMEAGEEWATVLVQVEAEEMDFPVMEEFQPISVVAHLPPSGLQRYKYDPTHMNLTIRDSHRKKLLELYETGDLADTTKPILNKTGRAKYSSTTFQSTHAQPMPQIGPIDWSGMQVMGRQNEEEMSITPPETGSVRSGGSVDLAKEKMLKKPIVVEEPESDEGGSLLSFEKEAAKNAELNKSVVKFQVASVRE